MLVSVIYAENMNCGAVHSSRLEYLIKKGLIFAFRRPDEWVIIGKRTEHQDDKKLLNNMN
jgi:hypothetical protein